MYFYFTNVASAIHSSMDTVLFRRALPAINCVYTMCLTGIWKVFKGIWKVFERYLTGIWKVFERYLAGIWQVFERYLKGIWQVFDRYLKGIGKVFDRYLKGIWQVFERYLTGIWQVFDRYLKGIGLICISSSSHPLDEWSFLYHKRAVAAIHSFKFTMSLQKKSCSKEIS